MASVKRADAPAAPAGGSGLKSTGFRANTDPARVSYSATLQQLLMRAYQVRIDQISGPQWLQTERYNIAAKVPEGAPLEQIPEMLQNLLAARLGVAVHWEDRLRPVYVLTVGKTGAHLKDSQSTVDPVAADMGGPERPARLSFSGGHMELTGATLGGLANVLTRFLDRPVVDMTGISGKFDISLDIPAEEMAGLLNTTRSTQAPDSAPTPEAQAAGSLFIAVARLGLGLKAETRPTRQLVVDKASRVPTEN